MSETQPMTAAPLSGPSEAGSHLFSAFQAPPARRSRWPWLVLAAAAALLLGVVVDERRRPPHYEVLTTRGVFRVYQGQAPQEVRRMLGRPIAQARDALGRGECFQYGAPSLDSPAFLMYTVCYEEGRVRDVTHRRYNTWRVGNDGSILPGGAPVAAP